MYSKNEPQALSVALHAVLHEAKALGLDVNTICMKAIEGLKDGSKPYRGGSAIWVVPASDAIKNVLADVNR